MSEHTLHWSTGGGVRRPGVSSPPGHTLAAEDGLEAGVTLSAPPREREERERGLLPMIAQIYRALAPCRPLSRSKVRS